MQRYRNWQENAKLLVFTDLPLQLAMRPKLSVQFQGLQAKGIGACFFPLLRQDQTSRNIWRGLAHNLDLYYASDLIYGRKATLNNGNVIFFVQKGGRFFFTQSHINKIGQDIQQGHLNWQQLQAIDTISYTQEQLYLDHLPEAFAKRQNRRVVRLGAYVSNLAKSISKCLKLDASLFYSADTGQAQIYKPGYRKVLVRNSGRAFWLDIDENALSVLQRYHKKKVYLGLHWQYNQKQGALVNRPKPLYVRKENQVPQLFVWTWSEWQNILTRVGKGIFNKEDIWFMKLEILRIKHEKKAQDIRG